MARKLTILGLVLVVTATATAGRSPHKAPLVEPASLSVAPTRLSLEVGEHAVLESVVHDSLGETIDTQVVYYSRSRQSVAVSATGEVRALRPGVHTVVALVPRAPGVDRQASGGLLRREVEVRVPSPPIAEVEFVGLPEGFFVGTEVALGVEVRDRTGEVRHDVPVEFSLSQEGRAVVDEFGNLDLLAAGAVRVEARAGTVAAVLDVVARRNPIASIDLWASAGEARTGDVVRFRAIPRDAKGAEVKGAPVHYSVSGRPNPRIVAPGAASSIDGDGVFVAERSGLYRVVATVGDRVASKTLRVTSRDAGRSFEVVGQAAVRDRHTSDLWVWESQNGRDYAITGTWGAGGHAYLWDVTNPEGMVLVDTVRVDARTVNDVKVDAQGRLAVISREGASDRKNGIVILDVSEPERGVRIAGEFSDQLNGGVHNIFVYEEHVYAVNNGRRFDVINIENPAEPYRAGRFQLDVEGPAIHDIWVVDGIAFTSNWKDGVVAIDVGGGDAGGSPSRPVKLGQYAYPNGWNHAAFPYRSPSTGKFYVFAGDEAFPYAPLQGAEPIRAAGWIHVIEWERWDSPREVARYQVPEAGSHNFWVEEDVLYVGYYNAGLRAVDVSGELRGDLYRQGREMAFWLPLDAEGYVANAAFTWGPQPFKGHIFAADWNSGLWAVRLRSKAGATREIGEPQ
jgi:hypothetical protein